MILIKNVLVATDFSEPSDAALNYGRELARTFTATLHVLHVADNVTFQYGVEGTRRCCRNCSRTSKRRPASNSTG